MAKTPGWMRRALLTSALLAAMNTPNSRSLGPATEDVVPVELPRP